MFKQKMPSFAYKLQQNKKLFIKTGKTKKISSDFAEKQCHYLVNYI